MALPRPLALSSLVVLAGLSACGGGLKGEEPGATTLSVQLDAEAPDVHPTFHAAPVLLAEPETDAAAPQETPLTAAQAALSTRALTADRMGDASRARILAGSEGASAKPLASSATVVTYSPTQIRAAYGLPALASATPAQLGAGQTIYIVNAKHNPNVAAELGVFNAKFGLPTCTSRVLAASAKTPLAAAGSACELVVAYATSVGALTATAPAYDSGWATEIALDVQWAHAIAPLARLVLIEAPDASATSLANAVRLANAMGPGVVSMSFGAAEGAWTASYESAFNAAGMSYVAATGDDGAAVSWPAVSPRVLAVSGTSLSWSGSGVRSETVWAGTGGGVSAFTATPSYQSGLAAKRSVADVAFNANPNTGQFVAVMAPGATTASWISAGGTSLATPQWAGLLAVANALRAQASKAPLGQPHVALYGGLAKQPVNLTDITRGSNGSCTTCTAKAGYDNPTGWGTPNAAGLLAGLSGAAAQTPTSTPAALPSIASTPISGTVGKALSATIAYDLAGASSAQISVSGAPQGLSLAASSTGLALSWAKPTAGAWALKLSLSDNLGRTANAGVSLTIK